VIRRCPRGPAVLARAPATNPRYGAWNEGKNVLLTGHQSSLRRVTFLTDRISLIIYKQRTKAPTSAS